MKWLLYKIGQYSKTYRLMCYNKTKSAPWGIIQWLEDSDVIPKKGVHSPLKQEDFDKFLKEAFNKKNI